MSNVLSRLNIMNKNDIMPKKDELNALTIDEKHTFYTTSTLTISDDFRQRLIDEYFKDSTWMKIKKIMKNKNDTTIFFVEKNDLIYKLKNFTTKMNERHVYTSRRLCLFEEILKDIFRTIHEKSHLEYHKCYQILFVLFCIKNLIEKLKIYLKHCHEYQINQIKRHKTHEFLQFIDNSKVFFHIIIIDFILTLSRNIQSFDVVISITCKFFKKMTLISNKTTWFVQKWIITLLNQLNIMNWDLSKIIINDRDSKFFNEFWKTLFIKLKIPLFYNIVYHSQIDDQSKRINQSIKIALRYHFVILNKFSN